MKGMNTTVETRSSLALFGGPRTIARPLQRYSPIGPEEVEAAKNVVASGVLSQYIGAWTPDFYGGPKVQEFERACEAHFGVKHAVTVNSWTSGLIAAVGAIGIEPGDEVIVTPWTMAASATAIVHWNAIPVFADIEPRTFCLDPASVEARITPRTRAIMSVDIFGHPADTDTLLEICERHGLQLISDAAQSPGARYKGRWAGACGHVGGFSLNYHKHIHTGEGGILVTDDARIARRLQLIRNHAEAVVGGMGEADLSNMIGHNFRLGEIECAIGLEQLKKLEGAVHGRQRAAARLTARLARLPGLRTPQVAPDCTHVYYVYPMLLDLPALGVGRARLKQALEAEGLEGLMAGYANVHLLPMYQRKIAYGSKGFPWTAGFYSGEADYAKGICPVAERLHDEEFLGFQMCLNRLDDEDVDLVAAAFEKVWSNLESLR
jgi:dTDP-4-amino-4,6-dideoxygalactose transaminase